MVPVTKYKKPPTYVLVETEGVEPVIYDNVVKSTFNEVFIRFIKTLTMVLTIFNNCLRRQDKAFTNINMDRYIA